VISLYHITIKVDFPPLSLLNHFSGTVAQKSLLVAWKMKEYRQGFHGINQIIDVEEDL
jgi:hypothetical protein